MILNFGTLLLLVSPIRPHSSTSQFSARAMLHLPEVSCKALGDWRVNRVFAAAQRVAHAYII